MKRIFVMIAALALLLTACTADAPADSEVPSATAAQTPAQETSALSEMPESENTNPVEAPVPESTDPTETPMPESSAPMQTSEPTKPIEEQESNTMVITINGQTFYTTLYDNETVSALKAKLPLTLNMSELNGNEKFSNLSFTLPTNASNPGQIHTGDLMLYGSNCLVLFYKNFSTGYSYTPIGRVDDPFGLTDAVGHGGVQVTFALG